LGLSELHPLTCLCITSLGIVTDTVDAETLTNNATDIVELFNALKKLKDATSNSTAESLIDFEKVSP